MHRRDRNGEYQSIILFESIAGKATCPGPVDLQPLAISALRHPWVVRQTQEALGTCGYPAGDHLA